MGLNWHQFRGICGQPLSWVKIFNILFSDYKIIKLPLIKVLKNTNGAQRQNQNHPSSNHPQTAPGLGRHSPKHMRALLILCFQGYQEIQMAFHLHSLKHFCRKKEKGNSPLLDHSDNLIISKASQFPSWACRSLWHRPPSHAQPAARPRTQIKAM